MKGGAVEIYWSPSHYAPTRTAQKKLKSTEHLKTIENLLTFDATLIWFQNVAEAIKCLNDAIFSSSVFSGVFRHVGAGEAAL